MNELNESEVKKGFLNRDVIKYIVIVAMTLDHIGMSLFYGEKLGDYLRASGSIVAITMCFFLVEGYGYTSSKKKYINRLLFFAIISQVPFYLALELEELNMLFTLLVCFLILVVLEKVNNIAIKIVLVLVLTASTYFMDWPISAPIFVLLFAWAGKNKVKQRLAIAGCTLFDQLIYIFYYGKFDIAEVICFIIVGIMLTCCYNGKRMEKGRKFSKWFFYIYYPLHLAVIAGIKYLL